MNIFVTGLNHKTAPLEIREKYAFHEEDLPGALKSLKNTRQVLECAILSTCNRTEICALLMADSDNDIRAFIINRNNQKESSNEEILHYFYTHRNEKALEHLCRVSSGLDSMVLGEPQIFGQMKDAFKLAVDTRAAGPVLRSLFPQIISLTKKVRSLTNIGRNCLSVSSAAVNLAKSIFSDIQGRNVMIIGAGEMGELSVKNLIHQGVRTVFVANRTFEKAVTLSEVFKGTPIMFYEIFEYLPNTDIVISSIDARKYVINRDELAEVMAKRNGKPLIIIDISVPRSVNPDISGLENIHLYNIDDLKSIVDSNLSIKTKEAKKADQMIRDRVRTILGKLDADDLVSNIIDLKNLAEEIRVQGYNNLLSSLEISDNQKGMIEDCQNA
jgi:glutamyl-tRNA reductase